ncbi:MAG: transcriptional repressor [Deltaproteobacteria bacterium]|nr:MAG: transcriptional repressor [Deltaproteobacteria bacterium]
MSDVNERLKQFARYLDDQGLRYTSQRRVIAEAFYGSGKHLSLNEVLELARDKQGSIGFATVYRTMKLLAESGLAIEHRFDEDGVRYEPAGHDHHDHLICNRCGRIIEFEDEVVERRQEQVAKELGFRVASHRHEIYGECLRDPCPYESQSSQGRVTGVADTAARN